MSQQDAWPEKIMQCEAPFFLLCELANSANPGDGQTKRREIEKGAEQKRHKSTNMGGGGWFYVPKVRIPPTLRGDMMCGGISWSCSWTRWHI